MTNLKFGYVQPNPNVQNTDILNITMPLINRIKVEGKSESTITSYVRAVEKLVRFHSLSHPKDIYIYEVLDGLVSLAELKYQLLEVGGFIDPTEVDFYHSKKKLSVPSFGSFRCPSIYS